MNCRKVSLWLALLSFSWSLCIAPTFGATLFQAQEDDDYWRPMDLASEPFKPPEPEKIVLPAGMPLNVVLLEELYSQRNEEGDQVVFALKEDVYLLGKLVIAKGTPVFGRISRAKAAKSWGRSGSIAVEVSSLWLPYGLPVPLTEQFSETEGSKTGKLIVGLVTFGWLFGGAIKGKKITIEPGTEVSLYTAEDREILALPEEELRTQVDDWHRAEILKNFLGFSWSRKRTVQQAFENLSFSFDPEAIKIEDMENFRKRITVEVVGKGNACFVFSPFEDVHPGGGAFKPLKPENELAKQVMKQVH